MRGRRLTAGGTAYPLGRGRLVLVAAGKAAANMARAAERILGRLIDDAIAVAPAGPPSYLRRTRLMVAGHPVPDARGAQAAAAVLALARGLGGRPP